jgi:predicted MFS family arabinose efflux permease
MVGAPGSSSPTLTLNLLALGNFVVGMGAFVVIGIISPIAAGLSVSQADAGIILTAYAIAYALLSPVGAAITGQLPRHLVLVGALVVFLAGTIASALAESLQMLVASRVVVAFGAALYTPLSAGVAVAISSADQRGRALARVFGGMTLAQVVGVPAGAWLAYRFGWTSAFWAVGALTAAVAVVLATAVPRNVAFQAANLSTLGRALRDARLMFATTFTATIMTAVYIVFTFFGPLIEASVGTDPETRTLYLLLYGSAAVVGNFVGGTLSDRIGPFRTLLVICAVQAALMPLLSTMPWSPVVFGALVTLWSVFGWSFMAPQQSRLVNLAPQAQALALALNAAMIYVGIAIGSAIGSSLFNWQGLSSLGLAGGLVAVFAMLHLVASNAVARQTPSSTI